MDLWQEEKYKKETLHFKSMARVRDSHKHDIDINLYAYDLKNKAFGLSLCFRGRQSGTHVGMCFYFLTLNDRAVGFEPAAFRVQILC